MKTMKPSSNDTRHLLNHPAVVRQIQGALMRRGTPRQDLADGVARVQLEALEAVHGKRMPADVEEWKALCTLIAVRLVQREVRRAIRRSRWNDGLCEEPDEHGPLPPPPGDEGDPVLVREQLAAARAELEAGDMPDDAAAILGGVVDGYSAKQIALALGLTTSTVENRISRVRKRLRGRTASGGEEG